MRWDSDSIQHSALALAFRFAFCYCISTLDFVYKPHSTHMEIRNTDIHHSLNGFFAVVIVYCQDANKANIIFSAASTSELRLSFQPL